MATHPSFIEHFEYEKGARFMIQIQEVTKQYGKKQALHPISFEIPKGEVVALCGGNGAGKSTLMKAITAIHRPSSGTIQLNGISIQNKNNYKKQFGYMPDDLLFPIHLTAKENLEMMAHMQQVPIEKVGECLQKVGLFEVQDASVKSFSKGMHQRLNFAQSLLSESPILLLDEPTNGLDPYWVSRLQEMIKEEQARGRTILFTTHLLPIVERIADRLIFIREGQLLFDEKVATILEKEKNLDTYLFRMYDV